MTARPGPLSGVTVVEVSSFVAAPLAGLTLGQLGAEVIRIDPVGGGPDAHRWPLSKGTGTSLYWAGLNKGKRSVQLDLRTPQGAEVLAVLLTRGGALGGIVLSNAVGRREVGYDALRRHREDLIHVEVMGKPDGSPAVDYTVNAASGFPMITGPAAISAPVNHVLPAWDALCGIHAAFATVTALRQRDITGAGTHVQVALEDVAVSLASHLGYLAEAEVNRYARAKIGNHLYGAFASDFTSLDGRRYMVVAITHRQWTDLVEVTGMQQPISALAAAFGADFSHEDDRFKHREVLAALFQEWFGARTGAQLEDLLAPMRVLWAPFQSFEDVLRTRESGPARDAPDERQLLTTIDQPGVGAHFAAGSPLVFDGWRPPAAPAPVQGADTAHVLAEIGAEDSSSTPRGPESRSRRTAHPRSGGR